MPRVLECSVPGNILSPARMNVLNIPTAASNGDQVFKHLNLLGTLSFKPVHSTPGGSQSPEPHHRAVFTTQRVLPLQPCACLIATPASASPGNSLTPRPSITQRPLFFLP